MSQQLIPLEQGQNYHIYNRGIDSCQIFRDENDYLHFLELHGKFIDPIAQTISWVLMPNHFHFFVRIKKDVIYKYSKEEIAKANAGNVVRSIDTEALSNNTGSSIASRSADTERLEFNKWATIPLPDGVKDLSALKGSDALSALKRYEILSTSNMSEKPESFNPKVPSASKHFSHLFNAYAKYFNTKYQRHGALFERPFKRKLVDSEDYLKQLIIYIHNNPVHHGFIRHAADYRYSSYLDYVSGGKSDLISIVTSYFGDLENFILDHDCNADRSLTLSGLAALEY